MTHVARAHGLEAISAAARGAHRDTPSDPPGEGPTGAQNLGHGTHQKISAWGIFWSWLR